MLFDHLVGAGEQAIRHGEAVELFVFRATREIGA